MLYRNTRTGSFRFATSARFAKVDEAIKAKFFSKNWGSTLLSEVGLDPSEAETVNTMLQQTWNAAFDAVDSTLEKGGVDTTRAGKAGFTWNYAAAGVAYYVADATLRSLFTRKQVAPDAKLAKTTQQLVQYSEPFAKKPKELPKLVQSALAQAQTAAAKSAKSFAETVAKQPEPAAAEEALPKAARTRHAKNCR